MKKYDVVALGELLIDFTDSGLSAQGNPVFEANPGGAPCNVLAMLRKLGYRAAFVGKVGRDGFGKQLAQTEAIATASATGSMSPASGWAAPSKPPARAIPSAPAFWALCWRTAWRA